MADQMRHCGLLSQFLAIKMLECHLPHSVNLAGLANASDLEIWAYARNASTAAIEVFIRSALVKIRTFEISAEESLLVLT